MKTKLIAVFTAALTLLSLLSSCGGEKYPTGKTETTAETPNETTEQLNEEPEMQKFIYDRVVLIGVDGAGAFFKEADTPNIDRIFADGAVSYDVLTSDPTISAECWGSMLHGVVPKIHRLTNGVISEKPYDTESPFPSVFRVIRENLPDAQLASFCNWNPINIGIIEDNLDVHKDSAGDAALTGKICDYIAENDPKFLFVQFDEVDGAGHGNGYGSSAHLKHINVTDGYIEKIYRAYEARGFLESTLFIVTADHGGTPDGGHGGTTDAEKYVMFAASGKTVSAGAITDMEIRDCASIVLWALGLEQPDTWTSRVPSGLFEGVSAGERPVYTIEYATAHRTHESVETPAPDSGKYITDILDSEKIMAYLPLDGEETNAVGSLTTTKKNKLYFVDGYFGRGVQMDDGYITLGGFAPDMNSFSVAMWVKTGGVVGDPALFSNKNWDNGSNKGFVLSLRPDDIKFNLGNGNARMDEEFALPMDFADGWVHVILSVDRENNTIAFYYDFEKADERKIPRELAKATFDGLKNANIGQDGTGRYSTPLTAVIDEFICYDGVLTDSEVSALADYYKN